MKKWIGKSIIAIGVVHNVVGLIGLRSTFSVLWNERLFNTVNGQPDREFAFWFVAFGIMAMIFGAFVDWFEGLGISFPKFLGWSLLAFTSVVVFIMPISGGWLMFVPAIGTIRSAVSTRDKPR